MSFSGARVDEVRLRWSHRLVTGDVPLVLDALSARSLVRRLAREGGARELRRVLAEGGDFRLDRLGDEAIAAEIARRIERGQLRVLALDHGFEVALHGDRDEEEPSAPRAQASPPPPEVRWVGDILVQEPARWAGRITIQEPARFTGYIRETPPC